MTPASLGQIPFASLLPTTDQDHIEVSDCLPF